MKRILFSIILFLILPSLAWADASSTTWSMPGPDDKSVIYLGYVFGVVNGVLHGTGSQIMGQMFAKFNSAVLALAGVVVFYTTILGLLSSAQEGEFLGKKYSSFFVPLRTLLGILLIAPTATGYSWIQVIVMWVVLQGVGAANMVWGAALNYLQNGGVVVVQNQDALSPGAQAIRKSVGQAMSSVTCLQLTQHAIDQITLSPNPRLKPPLATALESVTNSVDTGGVTLPASGVAADGSDLVTVPMPYFNQTNDNANGDWQGLNGMCGSLTFERSSSIAVNQVLSDLSLAGPALTDTCNAGCLPNVSAPLEGLPDAKYCQNRPFLANGAATCNSTYGKCSVFGLPGDGLSVPIPASHNLATLLSDAKSNNWPIYSWCNGVDWSTPNLSQTFNMAVMDYLGLTYKSPNNAHSSDITNMMAQQGSSWFTAGTFYFALIAANQGAQQAAMPPVFQVDLHSPVGLTIDSIHFTTDGLNAAGVEPVFKTWLLPFFTSDGNNALVSRFSVDVPAPSGGAVAQGQISGQNYGHSQVGNWSAQGDGDTSGLNSTEKKLLNVLLPGVNNMVYGFYGLVNSQGDNTNPVLLMMLFGSGMIQTAGDIWFGLAITMTIITLLLGAIPCLTLSSAMSTFAAMISTFFSALLLPLFITGCMLLYYLPAVPFMIFTFGTLGWIIGVIESMVAAPVVGFAIMSPEGNDLFGKGDPAVMLLLNIFLRPSLMIFGLIAGIMICYIGVWLINDGYATVAPNIIANEHGGGVFVVLAGIVMIPLVYMTMVFQVINRSFTLIYVLPDKVTRWISGGQMETLGSDMSAMEDKVKSSAQSGVSDVGKAGSEGSKEQKGFKVTKEGGEGGKSKGDKVEGDGGGGGAAA